MTLAVLFHTQQTLTDIRATTLVLVVAEVCAAAAKTTIPRHAKVGSFHPHPLHIWKYRILEI